MPQEDMIEIKPGAPSMHLGQGSSFFAEVSQSIVQIGTERVVWKMLIYLKYIFKLLFCVSSIIYLLYSLYHTQP